MISEWERSHGGSTYWACYVLPGVFTVGNILPLLRRNGTRGSLSGYMTNVKLCGIVKSRNHGIESGSIDVRFTEIRG